MDFNLALSITLLVIAFFVLPIVCYITCPRSKLDKIRYFCIAVYTIVLLIGVTSHITFSDGLVHIDYTFAKIWGDKDMFWGFADLTILDVLFNLLMLVPIGAYIASSDRERSIGQVLGISCIIGLIISLVIETTQYILPVDRVVQFSDTLFNVISAGLGAMMIYAFKGLRKKCQASIEAHKNKKDD